MIQVLVTNHEELTPMPTQASPGKDKRAAPSRQRFAYEEVMILGTSLLAAAGLRFERASVVAEVLVEAELLGYRTHGLHRLSSNLEWLKLGQTNADGDVEIQSATAVCETWNAHLLPGPWVVRSAVQRACDMAMKVGTGTIAISRAQHIACLVAYLMYATERDLVLVIMASTPSETAVAAHGGTSRIFSCNPIAVGIPTLDRPILIDTSASMSALGPLYQAHREGRPLDGSYLVKADGSTSTDPASYVHADAAILPAGGIEQGYKGFAWAIIIEALSAALTGYGRATEASASDGEANAVFVQAIAPNLFCGIEAFKEQMTWLGDACRASDVADGCPLVRMPGDRALALRDEQLRHGLEIAPSVIADLEAWGGRLGIEPPWT